MGGLISGDGEPDWLSVTYISPTFHEEPPGPRSLELVAIEIGIVLPVPVLMHHDGSFGSVDFDVVGRGAVRRIVRVGAADIGDFENHVGLLLLLGLLVPEGDADILHAVAVQWRVIKPVRMDGNLADGESVVGNTACTLVGKVVLPR